MRIYISGPITGTTDYKERFAAAEEKLEANGYEVVNPVKLAEALPGTLTHREHMKIDLAALVVCDAIYMLKGWRDSNGAKAEMRKANYNGRKILYEDGDGS